jgi:hypothetical protein
MKSRRVCRHKKHLHRGTLSTSSQFSFPNAGLQLYPPFFTFRIVRLRYTRTSIHKHPRDQLQYAGSDTFHYFHSKRMPLPQIYSIIKLQGFSQPAEGPAHYHPPRHWGWGGGPRSGRIPRGQDHDPPGQQGGPTGPESGGGLPCRAEEGTFPGSQGGPRARYTVGCHLFINMKASGVKGLESGLPLHDFTQIGSMFRVRKSLHASWTFFTQIGVGSEVSEILLEEPGVELIAPHQGTP